MTEPLAQALLEELAKKEKRRIKVPVTWETLGELIKDSQNPKPFVEEYAPFYAPPVIPPEFPKLKVKYSSQNGEASEWIVVQNFTEETDYHAGGWFTRPMAELEKLKADGVKERPATDWERRKQKST